MFSLSSEQEILDRLKNMLDDEDEDICVRLREYKVGSGWNSKVILGLSMDEMDEDEDIKISVDNIPFIAEESFLIKYGKNYTLKFDKNKQVVLTATDLQ